MSDLPFGIETKNTFARLSPADLQTMGKRAAAEYLCGGTSLNESIIKLARQHPSISPHQVQRVVEFANQEAFAKLFADNEKYAQDKNVEFDVADPREILLELNNGAKPHIMTAAPSEYSGGPVKLGHSDVEADLLLAQAFGVAPESPGAVKAASAAVQVIPGDSVLDRVLAGKEKTASEKEKALEREFANKHLSGEIKVTGDITKAYKKWRKTKTAGDIADKILASGEGSARPDKAALERNDQTPTEGSGETHAEEAVKVAGVGDFFRTLMLDPKKGELDKAFKLYKKQTGKAPKTMTQAQIGTYVRKVRGMPKTAMVPLPAGEGAHDPGAMAPAQGEEGGGDHHDQMLEVQREIELAKKRQELQKIQQTTLDAMNPQGQPGAMGAPAPAMPGGEQAAPPPAPPGGAPVEMAPPQPPPQEQMPPAAAGAITAPPGGAMPKTSAELTKEAMVYAKSGRPHAELVLNDLRAATSLEQVKLATADKNPYPMANPYGDLIRTKQKLAKLLEDATYAKGKNELLLKEATARFQKAVAQHLWDDGNLGEVAHLMSSIDGQPDRVKLALEIAMPELLRQGLDPVKAQAEAIQYEMVKGASARVPNKEHPIAQAYADMHKLAEGAPVLEEAWSRLNAQFDEVESTLQEAMTHAAAS